LQQTFAVNALACGCQIKGFILFIRIQRLPLNNCCFAYLGLALACEANTDFNGVVNGRDTLGRIGRGLAKLIFPFGSVGG